MNELTLDNYTYHFRLTLVHPYTVNKLDPREGRILCETATTGKFILTDVVWDGFVSPNSTTSIAFNTTGQLKIYEPAGFRFLDYIRFAALELGLDNHFDARYLLEMEIKSESLDSESKQFRYCWPIMFIASEVKSSVSEKGTEYNIQFVHVSGHSQTDMVQSLKSTLTIKDVSKVGEYFKQLAKNLELLEFQYAEAGEKAGGMMKPGGDHPAASDKQHDEYHFIIDPRIENYTFTTDGLADKAITGSWLNRFRSNKIYDISATSGTTIISQIQRILSSTKQASDLYLENYGGMPGGSESSSQSSGNNKKSLQNVLGKIYNFFRIETYTTYKDYDYIRGRYACKHIFIIYLALEPTLYQYPDELDELNKPDNKDKVITKLKAYIQEGLLTKSYYYQYTGMNTEILKFNIQLNQAYYLPSFPVVWATRGESSIGQMEKLNYSREILPFGRTKADVDSQIELNKLKKSAIDISEKLRNEKDNTKKNILRKELENKKKLLAEAEEKMSINNPKPGKSIAASNNRSEYLDSLKNIYAEDIDYISSWETASRLSPAHRPRVEPTNQPSVIDKRHSENEATMEKIWAVQLAARDLMEIEMDIRGDPFWLGKQNILLAGKSGIDKLNLPPAVTQKINSYMDANPTLDPDWSSRNNNWGNYDSANYYKGSNLFYLNSQIPTNDLDEVDLMQFNEIDQIIGIYKVTTIRNEFKAGKWIQTIKAIRDLTIPSQFLPRASVGKEGWESFVESAKGGLRALDKIKKSQAVQKENLLKEEQESNIKRGTISPIQNTDQNTFAQGGIDVSSTIIAP